MRRERNLRRIATVLVVASMVLTTPVAAVAQAGPAQNPGQGPAENSDQGPPANPGNGEGVATETPAPVSDGVYRLVGVHSGKAVDVTGASTADGADVIQWHANDGDNQRWAVERLNDGSYRLTAAHSGKALSVADESKAAGADVVQRTWDGGDDQRWRIDAVGEDRYVLTNVHSGKALDVSGASEAAGSTLLQWPRHDAPNQQFRFERLDDGDAATETPTDRPSTETATPTEAETETATETETQTATQTPTETVTPTVAVDVTPASLDDANDTAEATVTVSHVPANGFVGAEELEVTVDDSVARIENVSVPDFYFGNYTQVTDESATITVLDANRNVEAGDRNVEVATLTLAPAGDGATGVNVTGGELHDFDGVAYNAEAANGSLSVRGVPERPTATPTETVTPTATESETPTPTETDAPADPPTVAVDVDPASIGANETAEATVSLSHVPEDGLAGVDELVVTVDDAVAEVRTVETADRFYGSDATVSNGSATITVLEDDPATAAGATDIEVATLTLAPVGNGTTGMNVTAGDVQGANGLSYETERANDSLVVTGAPDGPIATPTETATPNGTEEPVVSIEVEPDAVGPGETATASVVLTAVPPEGLAGAENLEVSVDPEVAEITDVAANDAFVLATTETDGEMATIRTADAGYEYQGGERNVEIATLTLEPVGAGSTAVEVTGGEVQDDEGAAIDAATRAGTLDVSN